MARKKGLSIRETLEQEGGKVLNLIRAEIDELEDQLTDLRDQAAAWATALATRSRSSTRRPGRTKRNTRTGRKKTAAKKRARRTSPQVDWDAVLQKLPRTFTKEDLAKRTPKLAKHPKSRVVALARWSRSKQIKKVAEGKYQKTA